MALTPRSAGSYPMNRTIPLDRESEEKIKMHARRLAVTPAELGRRFIHEGLAKLDKLLAQARRKEAKG